MKFGGMHIGLLLGKLFFDSAQQRRGTDRDIFDLLKEYNDSLRQRKYSGIGGSSQSGDTKMSGSSITLSGHKAETSPENTPKTAGKSSPPPVSDQAVRPVPAKPDTDVPDYFTPYEGADMTCAEADAAGFEFVGADRYHGVDFWLDADIWPLRGGYTENVRFTHRNRNNSPGISGCAVTGWHGSDETVKIPRSINGRPVVKIEKEAFAQKQIKEIYLPDSVIEIADRAFAESALTYARLSKALVHIGAEAFMECVSLERVYMGNVRVIDGWAFWGCETLRQVRLPEEVWYIKDRAFAGSGLEKLYWNKIFFSDSLIIFYTPYDERHKLIVLGDTLQRCSIDAPNELIIDIPGVTAVGDSAFQETAAKKIILSDKVHVIDHDAFNVGLRSNRIEEVYAPGAWILGSHCFSFNWVKRITVSENYQYTSDNSAVKGYLHLQEYSFYRTHMEERCWGGSREHPCICAMVRNILVLARVELVRNCSESDISFEILTLSEDGGTLTMDDRVEYTAARHIPNLGAKKLIVSRNMHILYSFASIENFEEIVFRKPVVSAREKLPFRPKKSVVIRFKFDFPAYGKLIDSAVLLYLPNVIKDSAEAEKLYALYDRCLGAGFNFNIYDREILTLVSSYRARFTIARLRLEGDFGLQPEARERYENFLLAHKRKAEFTAKKHGDTALLSLLEKLSEKILS